MTYLTDRYVNFFTDYGFKRLFGQEPHKDLLREQVFEKFFEAVEIANFSPEEVIRYEDSLKYYRDLKNVLDTARGEGLEQGIEQGIDIGRIQEKKDTAAKLLARGLDVQSVMDITGLSREEVEVL